MRRRRRRRRSRRRKREASLEGQALKIVEVKGRKG